MGAADFLIDRGLTARVAGDRLQVGPVDRLTNDIRAYIQDHRAELVAELSIHINPAVPTIAAISGGGLVRWVLFEYQHHSEYLLRLPGSGVLL